jgi:hypothetical protein
VKEECLNRLVPLGEWHLRRTLREFVTHYHGERNHQGLANELIDGSATQRRMGAVRRRQRVGGILSYCYRSAAQNQMADPGWDRTGSPSSSRVTDSRRTPCASAMGAQLVAAAEMN